MITNSRLLAHPKAEFLLLNPRKHADSNEESPHTHNPDIDSQYIFIIPSQCSGNCCRQNLHEDKIPPKTMILVKRSRPRLTPVQRRGHPHGDAEEVLHEEQD